MNIKPLGKRLLVAMIAPVVSTIIEVPEGALPMPTRGRVVAVGDQVTEIKPQDEVEVKAYGGTPFVLDDKHYLLLKEDEVLAIHEEPAKRTS